MNDIRQEQLLVDELMEEVDICQEYRDKLQGYRQIIEVDDETAPLLRRAIMTVWIESLYLNISYLSTTTASVGSLLRTIGGCPRLRYLRLIADRYHSKESLRITATLMEYLAESSSLEEIFLDIKDLTGIGSPLEQFLTRTKSLRKLSIKTSELPYDDAIARAFQKNTTLRYVSIHTRVSTPLTTICKVLENSSTVRTLCIDLSDYYELIDARVLKDLLLCNRCLQSIDWKASPESPSILPIMTALKMNDTLTELTIRDSQLGAYDFQSLADMLVENQTLRILRLTGVRMGGSDFRFLREALEQNETLQELDVSNNLFQYKYDAREIGNLLQTSSIQAFVLKGSNFFVDPGTLCSGLVQGLSQNTTLRRLDVGPDLNDNDLQTLADCLRRSQTILHDLNLSGNHGITLCGLNAILDVLPHCSIRLLHLNDAMLVDTDGHRLAQYLRDPSCRLEELHVNYNIFGPTAVEDIVSSAASSVSLKALSIRCYYGAPNLLTGAMTCLAHLLPSFRSLECLQIRWPYRQSDNFDRRRFEEAMISNRTLVKFQGDGLGACPLKDLILYCTLRNRYRHFDSSVPLAMWPHILASLSVRNSETSRSVLHHVLQRVAFILSWNVDKS